MNEDGVEAGLRFREAGLARLQTARVSEDIGVEELLNLRERGLIVEIHSINSGNRGLFNVDHLIDIVLHDLAI